MREGFSLNAVAKALGMNPRTVKKYMDNREAGFTAYSEKEEMVVFVFKKGSKK